MSNASARPQIAVYYFPNYHPDPYNEQRYGKNWTEWELVKRARPRWAGHNQPRAPQWGYVDEADPSQMARKIDAAAAHGIDTFLFDWYWYENHQFLQGGLENGYLGATNRDRVKFALMWANHDWVEIFPARAATAPETIHRGQISRASFDRMAAYVVERYFAQPTYWKLDNRPYFSIYDLHTLIEGLGGASQTVAALRAFRERVHAAGHPGLHLNLVLMERGILPGESGSTLTPEIVNALGFDSVTSYVWVHHVPMQPFPEMPYLRALDASLAHTAKVSARYAPLPYYPNVTVGWDSSPRTEQSEPFEDRGYPFMGALGDNTPARFREALERTKAWLNGQPARNRIVTINAWNEWTEGSYLEPDTKNGYAYLEAIREVFGTPASARRAPQSTIPPP